MTEEDVRVYNRRWMSMFELYMQGKTLEQIGQLSGITRERVRQILSKVPQYHAYRKIRRELNSFTHVKTFCAGCEKFVNKTNKYNTRKYCSFDCERAANGRAYFSQIRLLAGKILCSRCNTVKPTSEFYLNKKTRRYYPHCKRCHADLTTEWKHSHLDRTREIARKAMKKYQAAHRKEISARRTRKHCWSVLNRKSSIRK